MQTRCPHCETIFQLGADDLRHAHGKVRCGDCGNVFNALEFLTEDAKESEDSLPVLTSAPSIISSADNPHKDEPMGEPENERSDNASYELEIKTYDKKTGEALSPPGSSISDSEQLRDAALIDDSLGEVEDSRGTTVEVTPSVIAKNPIWQAETNEDEPKSATLDEYTDDTPKDDSEPISAEAEDIDTDALLEFDDAIWERIPGVGAAKEQRDTQSDIAPATDQDEDLLAEGLSYTSTDSLAINPDNIAETDFDHAETNSADEAKPATSIENSLGFDVPENKWSAFFGNEPVPTTSTITGVPDEASETLVGFTDEQDKAPEDNSFNDEEEEQKPEDTLTEPTVTDCNEASEAEISDQETDPEYENDPQNPEDNDHSKESAKPHWTAMESIEEAVLSTGEIGPADIAGSLADLSNDSKASETKNINDWHPEHGQSENEVHNPNATGELPTWKSTYAASGAPKHSKLWLGAIIILIISFSTQLLHYNRDKLAASASYGELTHNIYNKLGLTLYPNWKMDNYAIRGSEAIAGESGQDVLDIRTQIASLSQLSTGLPQLRVVLRDRWSNPVAARTFTPEEYADIKALPADGMLQPNQTVTAHITIVDPGSGAQGYELELCLPRRDTGLECTGQPFK
ncbi:MAG: DUF3426 domain-containing protein [Gammaproteobacteria bacterium]|nr:DUF3426 domain-containing protein [Gammaproteobacteria bacterium]MCP4276119.1 DUF3426 domain-containing protein [Gammaproteobacteria bacterium]